MSLLLLLTTERTKQSREILPQMREMVRKHCDHSLDI